MEGTLMKRRLFAAAMAMTMVMASSIPALAYTIEDSTSGTTKSQELDLNATVHNRSEATDDNTEQRNGDKNVNVWAVNISSDDLTYDIYMTPTVTKTGYYEYKWDPTAHGYYNSDANVDESDAVKVYSFGTNEFIENGKARKTFTIENHSNFTLSASYATSSEVTGVTANTAFSTSDAINNLGTANSDVGYVYLDLAGINADLSYTDGQATKIGNLTINLTAGARVNGNA
jgi:hypothetical protein